MNRAEVMGGEIARWKSSGLSLMAYAKQSSVSHNKLLYWRSKLNGNVQLALILDGIDLRGSKRRLSHDAQTQSVSC